MTGEEGRGDERTAEEERNVLSVRLKVSGGSLKVRGGGHPAS